MSAGGGGVADLRASLDRAKAQIGELQSAIVLANDRAEGARQTLGLATEGTSRTGIHAAMAALVDVSERLDQAIADTLMAVEHIDTYAATI